MLILHSVNLTAILFSRFSIGRLKRSQGNGSQEEEGSQAVVLVRTYICTCLYVHMHIVFCPLLEL